MNSSIEIYLDDLKKEMQGLDIAIIRDALADAEEHLRTALDHKHESNPDLDEAYALQQIIEQYGSPEETAAAYAEVERRTFPELNSPVNQKSRSLLSRYFGIFADPKAWGAMLYMLVSLLTGIVYFTWVTVGLSLSVSFAIFIFGLPVALFFLISVRGIALLEGRLVEALLGVRMPRRSLFASLDGKWLQRLKVLLLDKHTWMGMLYMVVQLLLGNIYFALLVGLISLSLSLFAIPVTQIVFHLPIFQLDGMEYFLPTAALPFTVLFGFLLFTLTMHIARGIGQLHGKYAKFILVGE